MRAFWDRRSKESKGTEKRRSMGIWAVACAAAAAVGRLVGAVAAAERRPSHEGAWAWGKTGPLSAGNTCAAT